MNLTNASLLLLLSCSLTACSKTGTTQTEPESSTDLNTANQSENVNQANEPADTDTSTQDSQNVESNEAINDVALNDEDNESVATSEADVQIDTVDDSASTDNTDINRPDEPIGLKGVVYTDTEIELFWDRSSDTSIIEYTVKRDRQALTTVDALSYYDNTVVPGTTYEYTLQSVNSNGVHSEPVSLFLTTPVKTPTINATNAVSLLQQVATVTNGRQFARELIDIYTLDESSLTDVGFVKISTDYDGSLTRTFSCDQAGQFILNDNQSSLPSYSGEYQDCQSSLFRNESLDGNFEIRRELSKFVYNPGVSSHVRITELVTTATDNRRRTFDGVFSLFNGDLARWTYGGAEVVRDNEGMPELDESGAWITKHIPVTYVAQAFEGETRVTVQALKRTRGAFRNTENSQYSGEWMNELSAELTLQSPGTGNKLISVTTPEPLLSNTAGECYEQGQLKITAADGSELLLNANNGDLKTATVRVTADGVVTEETVDWTGSLLLFHATPDDVFGFDGNPLDELPNPQDCANS